MSAAAVTAPLLALSLVACGGSTKSPTAPSTSTTAPGAPSPAPTPVPTSGATIAGTVNTGAAAASFGSFGTRSVGLTVSVAGTSMSTTTDGGGNFTLNGVPSGDVTLQFTGTGVNASVTVSGVSDHASVHINVTVNGSNATVDDSENDAPDNESEVEGPIKSISGNTFVVGTTTVTVPTGTPIAHGGTAMTFAQLVVGDRVHVHGTKTGTNAVTAASVEVQTDNPGNPGPVTPPPGDSHHDNAELNGTVSALGGSCPSIHFTLAGRSVTADGGTKYDGTSCSTLANGASVKVEGTNQSNGTVLATSIEKQGSGSDK